MNGVIETRNLTKRYGRVSALEDLTFAVPEGSIYGLLGANGAGKTTALDLILNLQTASSGTAIVLGTDSRQLKAEGFRRIGYVSEEQGKLGWMTLRRLLDYLKPLYPTWDDARAAELVEQFRLPPDRRIRTLSRGMRIKAALASSMAFRPRLLVLDEPFSGLDPLTREELVAALLEGAEETTVVVSSHDLQDIETFVSHVGYLHAGSMHFSEELPALMARFREVTIMSGLRELPSPWPAHWLCPESFGAVVRFVDSRFDEERTRREVERLFGVRRVEIEAMSLRSILVALIRAAA